MMAEQGHVGSEHHAHDPEVRQLAGLGAGGLARELLLLRMDRNFRRGTLRSPRRGTTVEARRLGRESPYPEGVHNPVVEIPMFPLSTVVFPGAELPLHVFEERYRRLVGDVLDGNREFGTVLITAGSEVGGGDRRSEIGTLVLIEMAAPFDDGRWLLASKGIERIRVVEWLDDAPYPKAMVERSPSSALSPGSEVLGRAAAAVRRLRMLLSELDSGPCGRIDLDLGDDPTMASWMACAVAPIAQLDGQALLELTDPVARLTALIAMCCDRIKDVEMLLAADGS